LNSFNVTNNAKENNLYHEQEKAWRGAPISETGPSPAETGSVSEMARLYRSPRDLYHWFVYLDSMEWMVFPARIGGWADRRPLRSLSGLDLQEVPLRLAFCTGLTDSPRRRRFARAA
jgi:hypothetical protein